MGEQLRRKKDSAPDVDAISVVDFPAPPAHGRIAKDPLWAHPSIIGHVLHDLQTIFQFHLDISYQVITWAGITARVLE